MRELRAHAQSLIDQLQPTEQFIASVFLAANELSQNLIPDDLIEPICELLEAIYLQHTITMPEASTTQFDEIEEQRRLHHIVKTLGNSEFHECLRQGMKHLAARIFLAAYPWQKSSLTANFLNSVMKFPQFIDDVYTPFFYPESVRSLAFEKIHGQLSNNMKRASTGSRNIIWPRYSTLPPKELFDAYCNGTPLARLRRLRVPFKIPRDVLSEHCAIFAPSGHGKSELLKALVHDMLHDAHCMFILDSHGDLVRALAPIIPADRLHIIDPDVRAPKLNFFALDNNDRLFAYIFSALDREFTAKQSTTVLFILRLMQKLPNPTLLTLLDVMQDRSKTIAESKFAGAIKALDPVAQSFFATQFFTRDQMATRLQVANRIYTLLANPTFQEMFTASSNEFAPAQLMREGKIVLVNTSFQKLGEASSVFGRYVIARVLHAAMQRPAKQTLLILDEAHAYFDETTDTILSEARKFGLGLIFASQYLEQMPDEVKRSMAANTSVKLAGPVSAQDSRFLAPEMRTTPEFIRSMSKESTHAEFACYIRNHIPSAMRIRVPFGIVAATPHTTSVGAPASSTVDTENRAVAFADPLPDTTVSDDHDPAAPTDWR